jgi:hypothetical protein
MHVTFGVEKVTCISGVTCRREKADKNHTTK